MTTTGIGQTRQHPDLHRNPIASSATASEYGVLGVRDVGCRLERVPAPADLADLIERYWLVSWDLPEGRPGEVTLLPHPCVNLVFNRGVAAINGVGTHRFTYSYAGRGRVFGVKFRPAVSCRSSVWRARVKPHRPGRTLSTLSPDAALLDAALLDAALLDAALLEADLGAAGDLAALVRATQRHLRAHWPVADPQTDRVQRIVQTLLYDRSITRVDDVTERFGLTTHKRCSGWKRCSGCSSAMSARPPSGCCAATG